MTITKFNVQTKNAKSKSSDFIVTIFAFILILVLLTNPSKYAKNTLEGLLLFCTSVLPGLFPFMFLTKILTSLTSVQKLSLKCGKLTQKLFSSPGIGAYTLLLSNLSGYPVGAKIIGDLHSNNIITDADAKKMICYSLTSGPAFVIGTVGALMFKNIMVGIVIFISHLISNIISGILFCKSKKHNFQTQNTQSSFTENFSQYSSIDKILSESMFSTVQSILLVGGFISVFYCLSEILIDLKVFEILSFPLSKLLEFIGAPGEMANGVMSGIIEVTRGCKELSNYFEQYPVLSTSFACMLISFSGLSIIFQSKAFLSATQIKTRFLIGSKSVHAILSFVVCLILSSIVF